MDLVHENVRFILPLREKLDIILSSLVFAVLQMTKTCKVVESL